MGMPATTADRTRSRSKRFAVTLRVTAWLAGVGRFGILTSDQLARLDGGSKQNVVRGLAQCVEHGLLRRVDDTPEPIFSTYFDVRPRAYCITQRGLNCLEAAGLA